MNEDYRIENKGNVNLRGKPATSFTMFEKQGRAFVCVGNFFRPGGYDASDAQCAAWARSGADQFDDGFAG